MPPLRLLAVLAVAMSAACTALLDPERLDDVIRCDLASDCPVPENNRYVAACVHGEGFEEDELTDVDQVCVATFDLADCKPQAYGPHTEFAERFGQARLAPTLYAGSCEGFEGAQGCWPDLDGECWPGLEVHAVTGLCDDTDPDTVLAVGEFLEDWVAQDVVDQFCRSYFCDDRFVCDQTQDQDRCVPCDPNKPFGKGGCYEIYIHGQRSSVYMPDNESVCPEQASGAGARFGPLPEQVPE